MATHPRHAIPKNGNGSGLGGNMTVRKLEALLAKHEHAAAALRTTLDLLRGSATATKQQRASAVVAQAVAIDQARRGNGNGAGGGISERHRQRTATAAKLAAFDLKRPHRPKELGVDGRGVPALVRAGFLKRRGGGYVRTAKEYRV